MKMNLLLLAFLLLLPQTCTQNKEAGTFQEVNPSELASVPDQSMYYTFGAGAMTDSLAQLYKSLGVTSVESYVTWETCELLSNTKWLT